MKTIIYIAGYGRSGSTFLDKYLTETFEAIGVGELGYLSKEYMDEKYHCSCNKPYSRCELWKNIDIDHKYNFRNQLKENSPFSIFSKTSSENIKLHRYIMEYIFDYYKVDTVIDSSKSCKDNALRPLRLRDAGYNVKVIHLKRPLIDVLKSVRKGTNKSLANQEKEKKFRMLRCCISWVYSNLIALSFKFLNGIDYIYLDQRELRDNRLTVVKNLGEKLSLDFRTTGMKTPEQHIVAGNRLKYES